MIDDLLRKLALAPVMGKFHPLWPLCLPANVAIAPNARQVAVKMDSLESNPEQPVLITELDRVYGDRFLSLSLTEMPPSELINEGLVAHPQAAKRLLTNHGIADRIVADTLANGYRCVALMLVDGLSYEDIRHWPEPNEPIFVDGPSITFSRTEDGNVMKDVGFPAIVGSSPPLAQRLRKAGIGRARGYTYWDRGKNDVTKLLFGGMPVEKVGSISESLTLLKNETLDGVYIQLVRIGTDSLAHGRREVGILEIEATVSAVHEDLHELVTMIQEQELRGAVYVTSDHGMLWKTHHQLQNLPGISTTHPRYVTHRIDGNVPAMTTRRSNVNFHSLTYPYVGTTIRANNSGVHGGLSYWESIVPLVRVEVNA